MEKVIVTGATGFVGANLVRTLIKKNYKVHIFSRTSSNLWRLKDIYHELTDWKVSLLDVVNLKEVIEKIQPQHIVHLAVYGGRPNETDANSILNVNLNGTMNLIDCCKSLDIKTFINTGSSSEYGEKKAPMKETDRCDPMSIYGLSKLASTLYCNQVAKNYNKNMGTIRLFSPFGDFEDLGRLFPDVILNALNQTDIRLANPNAVRDFIYIEDAINLYLTIIENHLSIQGEVYNCGLGIQHSVEQVVQRVMSYTHSNSKIYYGAITGRDSDTDIWVSDITKTKNNLGWQPQVIFDEGIEKACEWFELNQYRYKGGAR